MADQRLRIRPTDDGFRASRDIPSEWMPELKYLFDFLGNLKRVRPELRWDLRITDAALDAAMIMMVGDVEKSFSKNIVRWQEGDLKEELVKLIVEVMKIRAYEMVPSCGIGWMDDLGKAMALLAVYNTTFHIQQVTTLTPENPTFVPDLPYEFMKLRSAYPDTDHATLLAAGNRSMGDPLLEAEGFIQDQLSDFFGGFDGDE